MPPSGAAIPRRSRRKKLLGRAKSCRWQVFARPSVLFGYFLHDAKSDNPFPFREARGFANIDSARRNGGFAQTKLNPLRLRRFENFPFGKFGPIRGSTLRVLYAALGGLPGGRGDPGRGLAVQRLLVQRALPGDDEVGARARADLLRDPGDPLLHRLAVLGGDLQ